MSEKLKTIDIHGRDYVQVNERIKWIRVNKPSWSITTELLHYSDDTCVFKACIFDGSGHLLSTGHAFEDRNASRINKTSYLENAESSAIGRAAGILGVGIDGSVASAEEVERAIDQQQQSQEKNQESKPTMLDAVLERLGNHREQVTSYLREIGFLEQDQVIQSLPEAKLQIVHDRIESLMRKAMA